jgi:hypothetical protein
LILDSITNFIRFLLSRYYQIGARTATRTGWPYGRAAAFAAPAATNADYADFFRSLVVAFHEITAFFAS